MTDQDNGTLVRSLERLRSDMSQSFGALIAQVEHLQTDVREVARAQNEANVKVAVVSRDLEQAEARAAEAAKALQATQQEVQSLRDDANRREGAVKATKVLAAMGITAGGGSLIERAWTFFSSLPPGVTE